MTAPSSAQVASVPFRCIPAGLHCPNDADLLVAGLARAPLIVRIPVERVFLAAGPVNAGSAQFASGVVPGIPLDYQPDGYADRERTAIAPWSPSKGVWSPTKTDSYPCRGYGLVPSSPQPPRLPGRRAMVGSASLRPTERSHSGLVQRFAKPPSGVTCFEGSNPSLSASPRAASCARSSVDRASGCGPEGRGFESRRARQPTRRPTA